MWQSFGGSGFSLIEVLGCSDVEAFLSWPFIDQELFGEVNRY